MVSSRLLGCTALLATAGCASTSPPRTARLTPDNGPTARIHATYTGGLTQRTLRASFTVDRAAYVLVGHLGGDGVIRILYPENARLSGQVRRGQTYSVGPTFANYDGMPQLFSFATRAWRSPGARADSYDGRGNGFVFIIASRYPLDLEGLHTYGMWNDDYELEDYGWTSDPRAGVRYFAESVTRGVPFTLKYANSFGTNALTSYASLQHDCFLLMTALGGFGSLFYEPLGWWGGFSGFSPFAWYFHRPAGYYSYARTDWYSGYGPFAGMCGGYGRSSLGYLGYNRAYWSYPGEYRPAQPTTTPAPAAPGAPTARGTERSPGLRAGNASAAAMALTRMREERLRQKALTSSSRREREPERFSRPSTSWDRGHAAPSATVTHSAPSGGSSRVERAASAPASAPAATPQPAKVSASGEGKPRQP